MPLFPKRIRDLSFWHYQATGWLAMAVLQTSVTVTTLGEWKIQMIRRVLLEVLVGFSLTSLLRYFYRWVHRRNLPLFSVTALMVFCSLIVAVVAMACYLLIAQFTGGIKMVADTRLSLWLFVLVAYIFPNMLAWSGLYFGITFWRSLQDERDRAERAAEEAQHAQLQTLRYRLNPRFLFDALTSARALVDEDTRSARQVVTELSEFLRYSLMSRDKPLVPLKDEIEAVRLYLSIEQRRYGEGLDVTMAISDATRDLEVPSFLIYPAVERALQSAMGTGRGRASLEIRTDIIGNSLEITIKHSGKTPEEGDRNERAWLENRLNELFPHQWRMASRESEGCTSLEMRFPLMIGEELEHEIARNHRGR